MRNNCCLSNLPISFVTVLCVMFAPCFLLNMFATIRLLPARPSGWFQFVALYSNASSMLSEILKKYNAKNHQEGK